MKRLLPLLLLLSCHGALCGEPVDRSLVSILEAFRDRDVDIIYSSHVVDPRLVVKAPGPEELDIEALTALLNSVDLDLKEVRRAVYVVVELDQRESFAPAVQGEPLPDRERSPRTIENVIVHSSHFRILSRDPARPRSLEAGQLRAEALLGGDPLRAVQQLPGSASIGLSARPRIRGGRENDALVLYDDVQLFEPYHLRDFKSIFSALDARIIDRIDLHTGGFPAQYGDRSSAVVDIAPVVVDAGRRTEFGIGLFNLSLLSFAADPRAGDEWLASFRRSAIDLIAPGVTEADLGTPSYGDDLLHYANEISAETTLSVNLLFLHDAIHVNNSSRTEVARSEGHNRHGWIKLDQVWGESASSITALTLSSLNNERSGSVAEPRIVTGALRDTREFRVYGIKQDWQFVRSANSLIRLGWYYRSSRGRYRYTSLKQFDPLFIGLTEYAADVEQSVAANPRGKQTGAYLSLRRALGLRITAEAGVRWDHQHFAHLRQEDQVSPRISMLYQPRRHTELRVSWGIYAQSEGIHELQVERDPLVVEPAEQSTHLVTSLSHRFGERLNLRLELYRNRIRDVIPYHDNLHDAASLLPELYPDRRRIDPDRAEARGMEVQMNGSIGAVYTWWLNYSHSSVRDRDNGHWVRRSWDQPDAVNFGVTRSGRKWILSCTGGVHTGWPTTQILLEPDPGAGSATGLRAVAGEPGGAKLDNYQVLNFKATREVPVSRGMLRIEAGVTNLMDRDNPAGISYEVVEDQTGAVALRARSEPGVPIAPLFNLYWAF